MESHDATLIELGGHAEENFDQASVLPPAQPFNAGNRQSADHEKSVQVLSTIQEARDKFDKAKGCSCSALVLFQERDT